MIDSLSRRAVLATLAAAAVAPRAAAAQGRSTSIVAAGLPEDSAIPLLYAVQSGMFKKAGLDVTVEAQRSGPAVLSGVAGGAYQIGKVSLYPLILAYGKGLRLPIVAPAGLSTASNPIAGLMVKTGSPIKTAADLNGKTIAVGALTDIFTLAMKTWMDKNGGDSTSVRLVEIPISAIGEAIAADRVVAGSANEPILGAALATGKVKVLAHTFDAIAPRFMFTAWIANRVWADANKTAVGDFQRTVIDAAKYANAHHGDTVEAIAAFTKVDPAEIRTMARTEGATSLDPALIQPVIDDAARYKDIPARFDARELIWTG